MSREVIEFAIKLNEFLTDVPIEETFIWELVSQNQSEILDRIIHKKKPWMIVQGYNINSLVDDRYPDDIYITLEEPHDVECLVKDGWNDDEELTEFDLFQKNKHKLSANSVFVCKSEDYAKGDYDDSIYDRTGNWFQPRNIDEAVENSQFIEDYTVQLSYIIDGCMKITKHEFGLCYKRYETLEHWFKEPLAGKFEDDNFNRNCVRLEMSGFGKYKDIKQIMNKRMTPSDIYLYNQGRNFHKRRHKFQRPESCHLFRPVRSPIPEKMRHHFPGRHTCTTSHRHCFQPEHAACQGSHPTIQA